MSHVPPTTNAPALTESYDGGLKLVESKGKKWIARGEFARADVPTANQRIYPRSLWEKQFAALAQFIADRKMLGESDHPTDGRSSVDRVSHIITGLRLEADGRVVGEAEILDTERGRNLRAILEAGGKVGVSSRGFGSVKKDESTGADVVQDDYQLQTFDFVIDPAVNTAYPDVFFEQKRQQMNEIEKARAEGVSQGEAAAEAKLAVRLPELMAATKAEALEQAKAELLLDPTVAGAKSTVESLVRLLKGYGLSEDAQATVAEKDKEVEALKAQVGRLTVEKSALEAKVSKAQAEMRTCVYGLYVERTLRGQPVAVVEEILAALGDLEQYVTTAVFQARFQAILQQREEAQAVARKAEEAVQEKINAVRLEAEAKTHALEVQLKAARAAEAAAQETTKKLAEAAKQALLRDHVRAGTLGMPVADAKRVMETFETRRPTTLDECKALLDEARPARLDKDQVESVRERLTRVNEGGSGARVESAQSTVRFGSGQTADEIAKLAASL